jgi:hypothetical protein
VRDIFPGLGAGGRHYVKAAVAGRGLCELNEGEERVWRNGTSVDFVLDSSPPPSSAWFCVDYYTFMDGVDVLFSLLAKRGRLVASRTSPQLLSWEGASLMKPLPTISVTGFLTENRK